MPGTPATTPNLGIPRYDNATDEANFAGQVNAISDLIDAKLAIPRVAAFPTTGLFDGMQVDLITASEGRARRFRYRSALSGVSKWEFMGGTPFTDYRFASGDLGYDADNGWSLFTVPGLPRGSYTVQANMTLRSLNTSIQQVQILAGAGGDLLTTTDGSDFHKVPADGKHIAFGGVLTLGQTGSIYVVTNPQNGAGTVRYFSGASLVVTPRLLG